MNIGGCQTTWLVRITRGMTGKKRRNIASIVTTLGAYCMEYLSRGMKMEHPNRSGITKMANCMEYVRRGLPMENSYTSAITKRVTV